MEKQMTDLSDEIIEELKKVDEKYNKEQDSFFDIKNDGACAVTENVSEVEPVFKEDNKETDTHECDCYTCQHKFEPALLQAYYQGQVDALGDYLAWLQEDLKIEYGPVDGKGIESLVSQMDYEYYGNCMLLAEAEQDNIRTKATLYIKDFTFNSIIPDAPFLAFYKNNREYKIFVKSLNFKTNKYELISFGDSSIYPDTALECFNKIIYMNKIFEALHKMESLKALVQEEATSDLIPMEHHQ